MQAAGLVKQAASGFTLIELAMVLVVAAILSAVIFQVAPNQLEVGDVSVANTFAAGLQTAVQTTANYQEIPKNQVDLSTAIRLLPPSNEMQITVTSPNALTLQLPARGRTINYTLSDCGEICIVDASGFDNAALNTVPAGCSGATSPVCPRLQMP